MSLIKAVQENNLELVQQCMNNTNLSSSECNRAFQEAASKGFITILQYMIKDRRVSPQAYSIEAEEYGGAVEKTYNYALQLAIIHGHVPIVRCLLEDKRVNPTKPNHYPLELAASYGINESVVSLLEDKRVDPAANNFSVIRQSIQNNFIELAKLFLNHRPLIENQNVLTKPILYRFIPEAKSEDEKKLVKSMLNHYVFSKIGPFFNPKNHFCGLNKDILEIIGRKYVEIEAGPTCDFFR